MRASVVVVGGGLAGITAALGALDAGCQVTLLEARPRLGGLTNSFRRGALHVDNGQHVFLRCCTSYLRLLDRLGVADRVILQPRLRVPVLRPGAPPAMLSRTDLPAPLHLAGSLLRYRALPLADRLRLVPAALALARVPADDPATDGQSFGAWLARHGQREAAVAALWDLVGVATLNAPAARASLALAATVFQLGLLRDARAGDIGWSAVPLQHLHGDPAAQAVTAAGGTVRSGVKASGLRQRAGGGWTVLTGAADFDADVAVLAVPPPAASALLPPGAVGLPEGWAARLGSSPIVNVHLVFDRTVLPEPFVAGVGTPVQWVFDRTAQSGLAQSGLREGQYLAVSLSAADGLVDTPSARLRELILPALRELLPRAGGAALLDAFVTRERHATFAPAPGCGVLRPPAATRLPGLVLAGAWTATGWPATMEGAVRSGEAAVAAALGSALHDREGAAV
jgi:squalene-associated FAD-dependent desaturase